MVAEFGGQLWMALQHAVESGPGGRNEGVVSGIRHGPTLSGPWQSREFAAGRARGAALTAADLDRGLAYRIRKGCYDGILAR